MMPLHAEQREGFFFNVCVCVRAFLPVCRKCDCVDVRHASCVGVYPCLCTCPAWVCVQPPLLFPTSPWCSIPLHRPFPSISTLSIICKTTQSCETKRASGWALKREQGNNRNWPVPLDPMEREGGGGDEVVMRWCGRGFVSQGER